MTKFKFGLTVAAPLFLFCSSCFAQLQGTWDIRWQPPRGNAQVGLLEVNAKGEATLDNTSISLKQDGEKISFDYQRFSFGGPTKLSFTGTLDENSMAGEAVSADGNTKYTWNATRVGTSPAPRNLSGVWLGVGFGGWQPRNPELTDAGKARAEGSTEFDDEALRCVSVGLGQLFSWPYLLEIVEDRHQIVFLYEGEREVRRIFMDGRDHPEIGSAFDNPMGHSVGHWDGRTLVIETTNLTPSLLANSGGLHHMGRETVIKERYTLSDDNDYIRAEIELSDPLTLKQPIRNSRVMARSNEEVAPFHCDPYSFFRQLYEDGEIEEYFEHKPMFEEK